MARRFGVPRRAAGLALMLLAVCELGGCVRLLMRLPEARGTHQSDPVDPRSVAGLGPWVEDKDAGLVAVTPGLDLLSYDLVVESFTVDPHEIEDDDDRRVAVEVSRVLQEKLVANVKQVGVFPRVADDRGAPVADDAHKRLRLAGEITRFDRGSRALRMLAGFGAGRTKLQVEMRFVDTTSGDTVLAVADRRIASKGLFGGDSRGFLLDSTDDVSRALAKFLRRFASQPSGRS